FSSDECPAVVAVHAALERGDVNFHDVAVLHHGAVRNAMADHFIDGGAQRFWKGRAAGGPGVPERRGVRAVVEQKLVTDAVQLICSDTRADVTAHLDECLSGDGG